MTDREVGELWHNMRLCVEQHELEGENARDLFWHTQIVNLIRKLVKERAEVHCRMSSYSYEGDQHNEYIAQALRDFGIDGKEWDEKN